MNNNDPVFCTLLFSGPYFGLDFLKVADPKKISDRPDKLEKCRSYIESRFRYNFIRNQHFGNLAAMILEINIYISKDEVIKKCIGISNKCSPKLLLFERLGKSFLRYVFTKTIISLS